MSSPIGYTAVSIDNLAIAVMSSGFDYTKLSGLPKGILVEVATPGRLEDTLNAVNILTREGYNVAPHIPARRILDESNLGTVMRQLIGMGVSRAFVIGGDREPLFKDQNPEEGYATPLGKYEDGLSLLEDMTKLGLVPGPNFNNGFEQIGIATHPDSLPGLTEEVLVAVYKSKEEFATDATSCIVLDPMVAIKHIENMRHVRFEKPFMVATYGRVQRGNLLPPHYNDKALEYLDAEGYFDVYTFLNRLQPYINDGKLGIKRVLFHTMSNAGDNVERTVEWMEGITKQ